MQTTQTASARSRLMQASKINRHPARSTSRTKAASTGNVLRGNASDPITLYAWGKLADTAVSDCSPLVCKVETFLRMAGLEYTAVKFLLDDPKIAPKKKLPSIKHGERIIPDSTFIIKYLLNTYGDALKIQPAVNARDRGIALAAQRMCDEFLYHIAAYDRWCNDEAWAVYSELFMARPPLNTLMARYVMVPMYRKQFQRDCWGQGIARHSDEEREMLLRDSLQALSNILADQRYITGDTAVPEDAAVFATLEALMPEWLPVKSRAVVQEFPNLVNYVDRITALYYPPERPSLIPTGLEQTPKLALA